MDAASIDDIARLLQAAYPEMADPRSLRPGELLGMLNSTPLGQVITEKRLRKHREKFGTAIGDGKRVDLLRYCARLMFESIVASPPATIQGAQEVEGTAAYERKKERERKRSADRALSGRDIGPAIEEARKSINWERRNKAEETGEAWLKTYLPGDFPLDFSQDQLDYIHDAVHQLINGGLKASALARGSGKTTIIAGLVIFAIVKGLRLFLVALGATGDAAEEIMDGEKMHLETNEMLAEDYPELVVAIRRVAESPNRAKGQVYFNERTYIKWGKRTVVFPRIANSKASGIVFKAMPLHGRIRGLKFTRPDGITVRPDFVFLDDPQTEKQAKKDKTVDGLEKIVNRAVLGLAGPKKKIAVAAAVTIMRTGCLAHRLTDRNRNPRWRGIRKKALIVWPTNMDLWHRYAEVRRISLREDREGVDATDFYKTNREAMDAGSLVAWKDRFEPDELSALQNLMNLWADDPGMFASEHQNEPQDEDQAERWVLTKEEIGNKVSGLARGIVPLWATQLISAVDIQQELLYWGIVAWGEGFTGQVVSEGAWPEQNSKWFDAADPPNPLSRLYPDRSPEDRLAIALRGLLDNLSGQVFQREGGGEKRIDSIIVDTGYQSEVVHSVVRSTPYAASVYPAKGRGVTADQKPITEWKQEAGELVGWHWRLTPANNKASRLLMFDSNHFKTFVHQRLATPIGAPRNGSLSLYGAKGYDHDMLASHLASEYPTKTIGRNRTVYVWKTRPDCHENHSLDWLTMSAAGASRAGITLDAIGPAPEKKRKKYTQADMQGRR
jgi:hypothetical protein